MPVKSMTRLPLAVWALLVLALPGLAAADELTAIVQRDLTALGYDTGGSDGEMNAQTAVAVAKFQAAHGLEVTGEITPQLAGIIKAANRKNDRAGTSASAPAPPASNAAATQRAAQVQTATGKDPAAMQTIMAAMQDGAPEMDPAVLQAMFAQDGTMQAQSTHAPPPEEVCLQQKIAAARQAQNQEQQSAQRRRGFGSLLRGLSRIAGGDVANSIAGATTEVAETTAAIGDLQSAARDLGLTEDEIASCQGAQ